MTLHVNPARAGMILKRPNRVLRTSRKPRASGDDPNAIRCGKTFIYVNPARAGMIPRRQVDRLVVRRKPRASGDDPEIPRVALVVIE